MPRKVTDAQVLSWLDSILKRERSGDTVKQQRRSWCFGQKEKLAAVADIFKREEERDAQEAQDADQRDHRGT